MITQQIKPVWSLFCERAHGFLKNHYFQGLEAPRSTVNRKHRPGDLIVISVCGVLAGADGPSAIGVWAESHHEWLAKCLELPNGISPHDTIGWLLAALTPEAFQSCFRQWSNSLQSSDSESDRRMIAIDGKAQRRSHNRRDGLGPLFLVSALAVQNGISPGQLATEEKSNEITAIPQLLRQLMFRERSSRSMPPGARRRSLRRLSTRVVTIFQH